MMNMTGLRERKIAYFIQREDIEDIVQRETISGGIRASQVVFGKIQIVVQELLYL
jgi:hypothetical protein